MPNEMKIRNNLMSVCQPIMSCSLTTDDVALRMTYGLNSFCFQLPFCASLIGVVGLDRGEWG
jgi:hypothetical protein